MLYCHTQKLADIMPLLERTRPRYLLAVDPDAASAWRCHELGIRLIGRLSGPWDNGAPDAVLSPADYVRELQVRLPIPFLWAAMTPNEPHPGNVDWLARVVEGVEGLGVECVVGNWGVGWDGFPVPWATWYGCHEYSSKPRMLDMDDYHVLRYRRWFPQVLARSPGARLLITECGITQAASDPPGPDVGWTTVTDAATYAAGLQEYAAELAHDAYVEGAFIFEGGAFRGPAFGEGDVDWSSFEILGVPELEAVLSADDGQTVTGGAGNGRAGQNTGEDTSVPRFQLGFKDLADRLGAAVVGEPETDERSLHDKDGSVILAIQPTTKGVMIYVPGGSPAFFPKA